MPARVEFAVSGSCNFARAFPQLREAIQGAFYFFLGADDADQLLHHLLQIVLNLIRTLARPVLGPLEPFERHLRRRVDGGVIDFSKLILFREFRGEFAGAFAERESAWRNR